MKEIKFRAKIKPGYEGFGYKAGDWFYWTIKDKFTMQEMLDRETLGQYTGLKDKNGKEIYEGDVIQFVGGNSIQTFGENSDMRVVEVLDDTKQLGWKGSGYTFCEHNCTKLVEVIGNVWENPELLQESP